jgi:hypothetical protein
VIECYLKLIAFCPKAKEEINAERCFSCKHYYGIKIVPRENRTWIAIECMYKGGKDGKKGS